VTGILVASKQGIARASSKPLQRSGLDKVPGRGRGVVVLEQVLRARVLKGQWPAAERSCWTASSQ